MTNQSTAGTGRQTRLMGVWLGKQVARNVGEGGQSECGRERETDAFYYG